MAQRSQGGYWVTYPNGEEEFGGDENESAQTYNVGRLAIVNEDGVVKITRI